MQFTNKRVLVLGAGISGISVAQALSRLGSRVTLNDAKTTDKLKHDVSGLVIEGITLAFGHQNQWLLDDIDYVVLSPGISIYSSIVQMAVSRGIKVMSEIEVAYQLCPAPILAVTGTNGKTTTTTLLGEMLKSAKREVVVGGNIGLALSQEVAEVSTNGVVVAEISSFQLEGIIDFKPHIAAVLNVTPDHIDRHRSMENYIAMKERIFSNQTAADFVILNYDDPVVRDMSSRAKSNVVFFSRTQQLSEGAFVQNGKLVIRWNGESVTICPVNEMKLFGAHNVENALAACLVAFLAGVSPAVMDNVLRNFTGVEHRIEPVAIIAGVKYYNDSKATNPESSIKALEAFPGHIILIAGGRDKNTDLTEFMRLARHKVDHLILTGEAKERFAEAAKAQGIETIHSVPSFSDAVKLANELASPPQVVLLSPACASYDMFNNYEERGQVFKDLVRQLE